ncbi:hypothetical protein C8R44DRAFT_751619 [Mycena epipterygia]|nr:hypothetical protein C8R44DRAFT_751619 [Mycena epipterygia]
MSNISAGKYIGNGLCRLSALLALYSTQSSPYPECDESGTQIIRGAVYAAFQKMRKGGWVHNDVVDPIGKGIRNFLWDHAGRPVLIDLVTATSHRCHKRCDELRRLKTTL